MGELSGRLAHPCRFQDQGWLFLPKTCRRVVHYYLVRQIYSRCSWQLPRNAERDPIRCLPCLLLIFRVELCRYLQDQRNCSVERVDGQGSWHLQCEELVIALS